VWTWVRHPPHQLVHLKAHEHGALNPKAQVRKRVTREEVMASQPVADPFTLWHCCQSGDGAAALVLASSKVVQKHRSGSVRIVASEVTSGTDTNGHHDLTWAELTARGAAHAYEMAGVGPADIDVAEIHDAFTIAELMYYEAFGFSPRGRRIPVNPSGGLLSRGHPIGATGAAQAVEIVRQLDGRVGAYLVDGAEVGLSHATGGGIAGLDHGACSIHVYMRKGLPELARISHPSRGIG
jgi:acetyl-CoA acetyltransferase